MAADISSLTTSTLPWAHNWNSFARSLKADQTFVPPGYETLFTAIEAVGRAIYAEAWTGAERLVSEDRINLLFAAGLAEIPYAEFRVHGLKPYVDFRSEAELDRLLRAEQQSPGYIRQIATPMRKQFAKKYEDRRKADVSKAKEAGRVVSPRVMDKADEPQKPKSDLITEINSGIQQRQEAAREKLFALLPPDDKALHEVIASALDRRKRVEELCRGLLWQPIEQGGVASHYIDRNTGRIEQIKSESWGTTPLSHALVSPPPGVAYVSHSSDVQPGPRVTRIIVKTGELERAARSMAPERQPVVSREEWSLSSALEKVKNASPPKPAQARLLIAIQAKFGDWPPESCDTLGEFFKTLDGEGGSDHRLVREVFSEFAPDHPLAFKQLSKARH